MNLAGAFAVVKSDYDSSNNNGLAGSFSGLQLHRAAPDALNRGGSDTLAYIRRVQNLTTGGLVLSAERKGTYWTTAAGGAGASRRQGFRGRRLSRLE